MGTIHKDARQSMEDRMSTKAHEVAMDRVLESGSKNAVQSSGGGHGPRSCRPIQERGCVRLRRDGVPVLGPHLLDGEPAPAQLGGCRRGYAGRIYQGASGPCELSRGLGLLDLALPDSD